ncbi:MAG: hypothetical protein WCI88_04345 [Chloroflexota bacterium]
MIQIISKRVSINFSPKRYIVIFLITLGTFYLSACTTVKSTPNPIIPSITLSPTKIPRMVPSATIEWFLPTPTTRPIKIPTSMPTQNLRPEIGDLIFEENFISTQDWSGISHTTNGSISLSDNHLNIVISTPKTTLISLYGTPISKNYYLETTANTNICGGSDEFGLLLRIRSMINMIRFSLACDGKAQIVRIVDGSITYPKSWMTFGAIPIGAPGVAKISIWAKDKEIRFFVNDQYLFTMQDPAPTGGQIGVYAHSANDSIISVNFSNLVVKALNP